VFESLWPQWASKLTHEQAAGYKRQLATYDYQIVVQAMRAFFDEGTGLPKPATLRDKAKALAPRHRDSEGETQAEKAERERIEQEQHQVRQTIDGLSDEQIAAHLRMLIATNPAMAWTARYNPRGNGLVAAMIRSLVFDRLVDGFTEHDRRARRYERVQVEGNTREGAAAHYEQPLHYEIVNVTEDMLAAADEAIARSGSASIGQHVNAGEREEAA
jgi:hypothetical protein